MSGLPPILIPGCDPDCEHEWGGELILHKRGKVGDYSTLEGGGQERIEEAHQGSYCQKCGGWRGALGNEPTIEMYVGHLVAIYREVYRVLREDGVAFCIIGDSFSSQGGPESAQTKWQVDGASNTQAEGKSRHVVKGLGQGNLMMVPHRLALALQADGWIIRNDLVYAKKSPMPESMAGWRWQKHRIKVKKSDRASNPYQSGAGTKQGAGVASRAQREAYYEQGAGAPQWIECPGCPKCEANPADCPDCLGTGVVWPGPDVSMSNEEHLAYCKANPCPKCNGKGKYGGYVLKRGSWRHTRAHEFVIHMVKKMQYWSNQEAVREPQSELTIAMYGHRRGGRQARLDSKYKGHQANPKKANVNIDHKRNPRSVLSPSPEPFPGKHFAVFSTNLIEPLIKATCPTKCCPECGQGWAPVVERKQGLPQILSNQPGYERPSELALGKAVHNSPLRDACGSNQVIGYRPSCGCGHEDYIPGTILDPFIGSGTTALVAIELGLHYYGCDISQEYVDLTNKRIAKATAQTRMHLT